MYILHAAYCTFQNGQFSLNSRPERPFGECPLLNQGVPMVTSGSESLVAPDRAGWHESPDSTRGYGQGGTPRQLITST